LKKVDKNSIINTGGETMKVLPRYEEAVIPIEKFTKYALDPNKSPHKALAFELALGYNKSNVEKLIKNIKSNLNKFPATSKGNKGFGDIYEVVMDLTGENGKIAKVLTGWLDDVSNGEMRMTTVYIDKRKEK
jgi:hypothetical protein